MIEALLDKQPRKYLKEHRHQLAVLLFISAMLLGAQVATLAHDADHLFHHHTELCDAFLAFQHASPLPGLALALAAIIAAVVRPGPICPQVLSRLPPVRNSRAPPAFTPAA